MHIHIFKSLQFEDLCVGDLLCMPKSRSSGSSGRSTLSFLKNVYTVLHSGCLILQTHKQRRKFSFSPHLLPYLVFVDILMV